MKRGAILQNYDIDYTVQNYWVRTTQCTAIENNITNDTFSCSTNRKNIPFVFSLKWASDALIPCWHLRNHLGTCYFESSCVFTFYKSNVMNLQKRLELFMFHFHQKAIACSQASIIITKKD